MRNVLLFVTAFLFASQLSAAESVAKITLIQGTAKILKNGATQWHPLKPNMSISLGDEISADEESLVEITYSQGEIVRLNEKSKIKFQVASKDSVKSNVSLGRVWVNMKKLTSVGRHFEVESPTAVAAIRGTIFDMSANIDLSASVSVFNGKVAVGPTDNLKKIIDLDKKNQKLKEPQEVPGPEEIPGPFEVSLEQWSLIVAGQRISVQGNGKYMKETFDPKAIDTFIKFNQERDKNVNR